MPFAASLAEMTLFRPQPTDLYTFTGTLTFTPAGATGRFGPTLAQCRTAYSSFGAWVSNAAYFNMVTQGIQRWTVPSTRNYTIVCSGAGNQNLGRGAILTASIPLTRGQIINILVGQRPTVFSSGSGGSFVMTAASLPIIVAGGSGGVGNTSIQNNNGNTTTVGTGGGGLANDTYTSYSQGGGFVNNGGGGGGAGYSGNGGTSTAPYGGGGGFSYTGGGAGGVNSYESQNNGFAGFGGGGASGVQWNPALNSYNGAGGSGGGGGYTGGAGGAPPASAFGNPGNGVGGYSFCLVTPLSAVATNSGEGYVSIT